MPLRLGVNGVLHAVPKKMGRHERLGAGAHDGVIVDRIVHKTIRIGTGSRNMRKKTDAVFQWLGLLNAGGFHSRRCWLPTAISMNTTAIMVDPQVVEYALHKITVCGGEYI